MTRVDIPLYVPIPSLPSPSSPPTGCDPDTRRHRNGFQGRVRGYPVPVSPLDPRNESLFPSFNVGTPPPRPESHGRTGTDTEDVGCGINPRRFAYYLSFPPSSEDRWGLIRHVSSTAWGLLNNPRLKPLKNYFTHYR